MNIFSKVTLQGLKKNRTRTVVTIIGIILSLSMLTAVTSFISSLQHYLVQTAKADSGDWHGKFSNIDVDFAQKLGKDSEVEGSALIQNRGYALLDGGQNEYKPYLFIAGFDENTFDTLPIKLTEGRLPQNSEEIVIPEHVKSNGGVEHTIGDTLTLKIGRRTVGTKFLNQGDAFVGAQQQEAESLTAEITKSYVVVGICQRPSFEPFSAPGYTVITKTNPAEAFAGVFDMYFRLKSPSNIYEYSEKVAGDYSITTSYNKDYLRALGISNNDSYNAVFYSLGAILIALITVGSVLLIYNSFSISVSERVRQFGILSSVGATKKQLRRSVLFEGVCIGLIGIPLGILLGIAGIGVTLGLLQGVFNTMLANGVPLALSVSVPAVVIAAAIGIVIILISAYIPARKAAKKSAIDSIRQTQDIKINARSVKTSKITLRLFGLEGMLARKNFKRNKKRYRTTVISLFVSIVLFVSASAFGMYLKQGSQMSFEKSDYDLSISSSAMAEEDILRLYDKLRETTGITDSTYQLSTSFPTELPKDILSERFKSYHQETLKDEEPAIRWGIGFYFIDDITYLQYLRDIGLSESEYNGENLVLPAVDKYQGYDTDQKRVVSFDMFEDKKELSLNLTLSAVSYNEDGSEIKGEPTPITVTFAENTPSGFSKSSFSGLVVFAPYSIRENFEIPEEMSKSLIFRSDDPMKSAAEMKSIVEDENINPRQYQMYNAMEAEQANRNILLVINVFTYGFITLMSLITIANVFNTISTNINLRRKEFAMLRSVGMTDKGFNKMMNLECVFYGVKALFYGLPVSAAITYLIYLALMEGVDLSFTLPWVSVGISVLGVFLVVFISMLYSTGKIKKENTVDALKND